MKGHYPPGATPLTPDEEQGLVPRHITLRSELNAFEQSNILEAETWLLIRKTKAPVADTAFLKELHKRMFRKTWKWAGQYRKSDRNIGVPWAKISYEIEALCRDVAFWRKESVYSTDEIAIRFHHKLVWIHCYPNGNGRHARISADLLIEEMGGNRFSWGGKNLDLKGDCRSRYIEALQQADENDYSPLIEFSRS